MNTIFNDRPLTVVTNITKIQVYYSILRDIDCNRHLPPDLSNTGHKVIDSSTVLEIHLVAKGVLHRDIT